MDEGTLRLADLSRDTALGRLRLLVLCDGAATSIDLPSEGEVRIGRAKQCDLVVEDASVSRVHAIVTIELDAVTIRDNDSQNGTRVGGEKLEEGEAVRFGPGTLVEIGRAVLFLQSRDAVSVDESPASTAEPLPPLPSGLVVPENGPMRQVYRLVAHVAKSRLSVLLLGATGVGKELVAESVHMWSPRAKGPLVRLNCAALAESLLESELFGHERGAFTGATQTKVGLIEAANGGTLFLDEIGEMPLATQAKLLRVLEAREVLRVGALAPRPVDIRLVAATHRDLEESIRAGAFRSDLFYRVNGMSISIPPLRERRNEIAELANAFARRASEEAGRKPVTFSPASISALRAARWPGNVRELKNVVERAVVMCRGDVVEPTHLSLDAAKTAGAGAGTLGSELEDIEKDRIVAALEKANGNQSQAARDLGMPRRTLVRRLREYGLSSGRKS